MLGVRNVPTGPDRLLDCLRALAKAEHPPVSEVDKWYRRLDQMIDGCSTLDNEKIKKAFREERITLSETSGWVTSSGVFLNSDEEDVPGAAVVRPAVRELTLWRKIGVADIPTPDLVISWLNQLPSGQQLGPEDTKRVRSLCAKYSVRIWFECGHWLNLLGQWIPTRSLRYSLTKQELMPGTHFHEWVKQETADLQRIPLDVSSASPFSCLKNLGSVVVERFASEPVHVGDQLAKPWLNQFGRLVQRIDVQDENENHRMREVGSRLTSTKWQTATGLRLIPYIDGTPAGTAKPADIVWVDDILYVEVLPDARLARLVPERIGRLIARPDIANAMTYCYGRSIEEVTAYMEENFTLSTTTDSLPEEASQQDVTVETTSSGSETHARDNTIELPPTTPGAESPPLDEPTATVDVPPEPPRPPKPPAPPKPNIVELFALAKGFRKDNHDRYVLGDGSRIEKSTNSTFPWQWCNATGDILRYLLPRDHCLEESPLEVAAEVWGFLLEHPNEYSLILMSPSGHPVEVSGEQFRVMVERGKIVLYPASYRLALQNGSR